MSLAPVYERDGITLYHGDCLDVMPLLLVTVDAVLADLPYGTTRNAWDKAIDNKRMWAGLHGLMGPRTPACLFGTGMFSAELVVANRGEFRYDLIWDKTTSTGFLNAKKQPLRGHENIHVFYRKQRRADAGDPRQTDCALLWEDEYRADLNFPEAEYKTEPPA